MTVEWSTEVDQIAPAFVAALGEMPTIPKAEEAKIASTKGSYSYRYADLAGYLDAVRPVLARHGLAVTQPVTMLDGPPIVTTTVLHTSGQYVRSQFAMRVNGSDAQAVGSAITYARRYALGALLCIATDDDDGAAATASQRSSAPAPKPITESQLTALATSMGAIGLKDRTKRLQLASWIVREELETSKDLTQVQAAKVIQTLVDVQRGRASLIEVEGRPQIGPAPEVEP